MWALGLILPSACDNGPRVPFKLADAAATGPAAAPPNTPVAPAATAYADAVDEPLLDGATLPLRSVRATLLHDLDGDDDRDAVALIHDAERRLRLVASLRGPSGFDRSEDVPGLILPADASCTLRSAALAALAPDKGLLSLSFVCGEARSALPTTEHIVSLERAPRVLLNLAPQPTRGAELPLGLTVRASADAVDGRHDIVITSTLGPGFPFPFRDRASGLSRDTSEPEASFAAEAKLADAELASDPAAADARASTALAVFDAMCREAEGPRMSASAEPGLPCGKSPSRLKLLATSTLARAKQKQLAPALARYREAVGAGLVLRGKPHDKLRAALGKLAAKDFRVLRMGPPLPPDPPMPAIHLARARFADEDTLLLGFRGASTLSVSRGDEAPIAEALDPLLRDPSGNFAVVGLERSCAGLALKLARVPRGEGAWAAREPAGSVLAVPSGNDPATCKGPSGEPGREALAILGWAPQGVVCARGPALWVVPLSADGQALGAPFELAPDAPRPAPLGGGVSTGDGSHFAELLPIGVALYGPDARDVQLLAPSGFAEVAARATDVALSPSGRSIAVVADGQLYLLGR